MDILPRGTDACVNYDTLASRSRNEHRMLNSEPKNHLCLVTSSIRPKAAADGALEVHVFVVFSWQILFSLWRVISHLLSCLFEASASNHEGNREHRAGAIAATKTITLKCNPAMPDQGVILCT